MTIKILATSVLALGILFIYSDRFVQNTYKTDVFMYGASVYPEFQSKEEQIRMPDLFQKANITILRVGESSWGNLEKASGNKFGVVERFLDKMHKCQMKAITALVKDIITGISTGNNGKCSLAVAKYFGIVV